MKVVGYKDGLLVVRSDDGKHLVFEYLFTLHKTKSNVASKDIVDLAREIAGCRITQISEDIRENIKDITMLVNKITDNYNMMLRKLKLVEKNVRKVTEVIV